MPKKPIPEPTTLQAQAELYETRRYEARMRSLKAMQHRLALLDGYMPAIKAAGLSIHADELTCWSGSAGAIYIGEALLDRSRNARLEARLRELGFLEVDRRAHTSHYMVELKKGRLLLSLTVWEAKPAAGAQA